jgi:hypothetical protein
VAASAKEITTYLVDFFAKPDGSDGKVRSQSLAEASASFVYEWGYALGEPCRVMFAIERHPDGHRWWVLISRKDGHGTTAFAISVHKALIRDKRFRTIQWFTDDERKNKSNVGHSLPY